MAQPPLDQQSEEPPDQSLIHYGCGGEVDGKHDELFDFWEAVCLKCGAVGTAIEISERVIEIAPNTISFS